jgi:hypothetical protein
MTGGNLALKSSANGTARIASGSSLGGYISGDVSVERYLSSIRSWRFYLPPATGQTIHQAWQENQPSGVNLGGVYGTNITSNASTWAADGFDFQTPGNSCLFIIPQPMPGMEHPIPVLHYLQQVPINHICYFLGGQECNPGSWSTFNLSSHKIKRNSVPGRPASCAGNSRTVRSSRE